MNSKETTRNESNEPSKMPFGAMLEEQKKLLDEIAQVSFFEWRLCGFYSFFGCSLCWRCD
jgi:hypothetical protein